MEIKRVIDLIVELENHDPCAPIEVWLRGGAVEPIVARPVLVKQATPIWLDQIGVDGTRFKGVAMPVVVEIETTE